MRRLLADEQRAVGDAADARAARDAGSRFAVSPGYTSVVGQACRELGLPLLPGVATASEVMTAQADGHEVVTVEGLAREGELHRVQQAFSETGAAQCGCCTPGLIVATADLLRRNPAPNEDEIREALSGNLCRCTGYAKIFDAVRVAAGRT